LADDVKACNTIVGITHNSENNKYRIIRCNRNYVLEITQNAINANSTYVAIDCKTTTILTILTYRGLTVLNILADTE